MAQPNPFAKTLSETAADNAASSGTRAEAIRRVQIGVMGLFAMVLLMGVASAISNRAIIAEEKAVPDAAPTTEPTEAPSQVDPLVDAGVVPAVPQESEVGALTPDEEQEGTTVPDIAPRTRGSNAPPTNASPRN